MGLCSGGRSGRWWWWWSVVSLLLTQFASDVCFYPIIFLALKSVWFETPYLELLLFQFPFLSSDFPPAATEMYFLHSEAVYTYVIPIYSAPHTPHTHTHTHTHQTSNYIYSHIYQHFIITAHYYIVFYHFNNS